MAAFAAVVLWQHGRRPCFLLVVDPDFAVGRLAPRDVFGRKFLAVAPQPLAKAGAGWRVVPG